MQEEGDVRGTTVREGTFEDDHGLRQITPEEDQDAELLLGSDRTVEMPPPPAAICTASSPQAIPSANSPSSARALPNQPRERTEFIIMPKRVWHRSPSRAATLRLSTSVALRSPQGEVGRAQHAVCYRLLDESPAGRGMHKGTLAVLDGRIKVTRAQEVVGHAVGDPPELALIVQCLGEHALAEIVEAPPGVSKRPKRTIKDDAELDALREEGGCAGRCRAATSACSRYPTASRWAARAMAFSPACWEYVRALSHTSPRRA